MIKWGAVAAAMLGLALGGVAEAAPLKLYTQWKGAAMPLDVVVF